MDTDMPAISGADPIDVATDGQHPLDCLQDFYAAFNQRDLRRMQGNWSQTQEASMSNPLGDIRRGWPAIRAVYERIFNGPAQVYVEFYDYSLQVTDGMFCAVGRERGHVQLDGRHMDLAIRTSRIYRKEAGFWRQLHHHGSIDDAVLLQRYQELVRTATRS